MTHIIVVEAKGNVHEMSTLFYGEDESTVVKEADDFFVEKLKENGIMDEETITDSLEDGYFSFDNMGGWNIALTWPDVNKVE